MSPKYKQGDILIFNREFAPPHYFYIRRVFLNVYKMGTLNQYDEKTYPFQVIDTNDRISLSLSKMLKQL